MAVSLEANLSHSYTKYRYITEFLYEACVYMSVLHLDVCVSVFFLEDILVLKKTKNYQKKGQCDPRSHNGKAGLHFGWELDMEAKLFFLQNKSVKKNTV